MVTKHVEIQGILPGQAPGLRKEFSEWVTSNHETSIQVSLFIRSLRKFYEVPYDQTLSYFQVAGISNAILLIILWLTLCRHSWLSGKPGVG